MRFRINFFVCTYVGDNLVAHNDVPDPMLMHTIHLGWRDRIRVLWHGTVSVCVSPASKEVGDAVMRVLNVEPEAANAAGEAQ